MDLIFQAGNTVVPAILALESMGLSVEVTDRSVVARSATNEYMAEDPVAVLGLVKVVELRGSAWMASDGEIDDTFGRFPSL